MCSELLKIRLFDDFIIEYKEKTIRIEDKATRQMMNLFAIFVYYRQNPINKDKLIEYMWQDSENPSNVMKFSIYRLRTFLKTLPGLEEMDIIITTKLGYAFNPNILVEADFEKVEDAWVKMNDAKITNEEVIKNAKFILDSYEGPIFNGGTDFWMIQAQSYFQNIYEKAFNVYCDYLYRQNMFKKLIEVGLKAISINPFDEEAHFYYLKALIEDKQYKKALEEFQQTQKSFYREFGNPLSLKLKNLYNIIIAKDEEDEIDVATLKERLDTELDNDGAFYCEYESFKYIYQVELRNCVRDNRETFLVIFEIRSEGGYKIQRSAMEKLGFVIESSLRKGDVYSRMNKVQYVLLLPCQNIDNAHNIIHRITTAYYRKIAKAKVKLHYHVSSLLDFKEKKQLD